VRKLSLPGARAERRARRHYRLRGYRILGSNIRLAGVEVDLLCRRRGIAVFCEVKEKTGENYGDPLEMVDERKQARLLARPRPGSPRSPHTSRSCAST